MFTDEEIGRLGAASFLQSQPLLLKSPFARVELFSMDRQSSLPPFESSTNDHSILGKRAEQYMSHYLHAHPGYEVIAEQVQVIHEKETIGEFDFFLKDLRTHEVIHMEMAYKLYLYKPQEALENQWVGPNHRDLLSRKLDKLDTLQFPLLHDPRARDTLTSIGVDAGLCKQRLSLQGQAFVPRGYAGAVKGVRNEAVVGTWCDIDTFLNEEDHGKHYHVCTKNEWMIDPMYNRDWHLKQVIKPMLEASLEKSYAPMVWTLHPDGSTTRTFIVWW